MSTLQINSIFDILALQDLPSTQGRLNDETSIIPCKEEEDEEESEKQEDDGDEGEMETDIKEIKTDFFTNQTFLPLTLASIQVRSSLSTFLSLRNLLP